MLPSLPLCPLLLSYCLQLICFSDCISCVSVSHKTEFLVFCRRHCNAVDDSHSPVTLSGASTKYRTNELVVLCKERLKMPIEKIRYYFTQHVGLNLWTISTHYVTAALTIPYSVVEQCSCLRIF